MRPCGGYELLVYRRTIRCQWRSKKGPPRRCKKGPLGGCGLVPVVHGRAPRATRRALNRLTRRRAREGPVGPRGLPHAGLSPRDLRACAGAPGERDHRNSQSSELGPEPVQGGYRHDPPDQGRAQSRRRHAARPRRRHPVRLVQFSAARPALMGGGPYRFSSTLPASTRGITGRHGSREPEGKPRRVRRADPRAVGPEKGVGTGPPATAREPRGWADAREEGSGVPSSKASSGPAAPQPLTGVQWIPEDRSVLV